MASKRANAPTSRVVAGQYGGRQLNLPVSDTVRPTKNMVLQGAFNALESRIHWEGKTVIDLCCGSGQWGVEALSRGAAHATFVDLDTAAVRANVKELGIPKESCAIYTYNVQNTLDLDVPADVVFMDPPYDDASLYTTILAHQNLGRAGTLWVVETEKKMDLEIPTHLALVKIYTYGKSKIWLLEQGKEK